jgi:hypothetical protein
MANQIHNKISVFITHSPHTPFTHAICTQAEKINGDLWRESTRFWNQIPMGFVTVVMTLVIVVTVVAVATM